MPFSEASLSLTDILDAIAAIEQFTQDMDLDSFRQDPKTIAAVERKLQVISEAAVRLGEQAEALCPGLPWRDIRGIGNWLRHQYDRVDIETRWYCSEPRLAFNRNVVLRYRISLEQKQYAPSTINLRLAAVRRIAYEAADSGLLSPELAAGIRRVKGVRRACFGRSTKLVESGGTA